MNNKKLLFSITKKDFDIIWFNNKKAGGQHTNKHNNCCKVIHRESGISSQSSEHRDRPSNLKSAFKSLVKSKQFEIFFAKEGFLF